MVVEVSFSRWTSKCRNDTLDLKSLGIVPDFSYLHA